MFFCYQFIHSSICVLLHILFRLDSIVSRLYQIFKLLKISKKCSDIGDKSRETIKAMNEHASISRASRDGKRKKDEMLKR